MMQERKTTLYEAKKARTKVRKEISPKKPEKRELEVYHFASAVYNVGLTGALNGEGEDFANDAISKYLEFMTARR